MGGIGLYDTEQNNFVIPKIYCADIRKIIVIFKETPISDVKNNTISVKYNNKSHKSGHDRFKTVNGFCRYNILY